MEELLVILNEMGFPFAYDHFAEGEAPKPPFVAGERSFFCGW